MNWLYDLLRYIWNFHHLPYKYQWRLSKLKRQLLSPTTGLGLRQSFHHASLLTCPPEPSPAAFVMKLLWPFPSWKFEADVPLTPRAIMKDCDAVGDQERDLIHLRTLPLWCARDTPERALYRLYEAVCANQGHMVTYETEYIWRQSSEQWATVNIPNPNCSDPEQYAVMAAVVEALVESFVWRHELGLRRTDKVIMDRHVHPPVAKPEICPPWVADVPELDDKLVLHPDEQVHSDCPFHRRNIHASAHHFRAFE